MVVIFHFTTLNDIHDVDSYQVCNFSLVIMRSNDYDYQVSYEVVMVGGHHSNRLRVLQYLSHLNKLTILEL